MPHRDAWFHWLGVCMVIAGCNATPQSDSVGDVRRQASLVVSDSAEVIYGLDQVSLGLDLASYIDASSLEAGGLAVLCCDNKVVVFDQSGHVSAVYGGRGEGPDEFRAPRMVRLRGDTLLIFDRGNRRISWVTPEAGVVQTSFVAGDVPFKFARPLGYQRDVGLTLGAVNTWGAMPPLAIGDTARSDASVARIHPDSGFKVLFSIPDVLLVSRPSPNDPVGTTAMDHVRNAGLATVSSDGERLFVASGDSRTLEFRELDGAVLSETQLPWPRVPVTETHVADQIRAETEPLRKGSLNGHPPPPNVRASLRYLEEAVFADSFPVILDLLPDLRGEGVWVLHGREWRSSGWEATFVDGDGQIGPTLRANLPNARPLSFDGRAVVVAVTDADGVVRFERRGFIDLP